MVGALADAVVVVHLAFVAFVAVGGVLAWRWRALLWPHLAAVAWSAGIVTVGYRCPLTALERALRRAAGEAAPTSGFVDRYLEGVLYPERLAWLLRLVVATLVAVGWAGLLLGRRRPARLPLLSGRG